MNFYDAAGSRVEPETTRILRITLYTTVPCNSMTTAWKRSANFRLPTLWRDSGGSSVALAPRFSAERNAVLFRAAGGFVCQFMGLEVVRGASF